MSDDVFTGLQAAVGRWQESRDTVTESPVARLLALLDRDPAQGAGTPLPLGGHLLYFLSVTRHGQSPADGGNPRDDLVPPLPFQRKLWLGARLHVHAPLRVGDPIVRRACVSALTPKSSRNGRLIFLTIHDEISGPDGLALVEEFDLLACESNDTGGGKAVAAPGHAEWSRSVDVDAPFLFKFSALTYNCHRIHYDHPYTTQVEGYPGLLVTGPLQQVLLLDLVSRSVPQRRVVSFECRAHRALHAPCPVAIRGAMSSVDEATVWTSDRDGNVAMTATVRFA